MDVADGVAPGWEANAHPVRSDFRASIRNCCVQAVARTCADWARRTPPSLNFLGYFTIVKLSDRGVERKPAEVAVIVRV